MLRQLFDADSFTYTYLLSDDTEAVAVIIDPVKEKTSQYLQLLDELSLKLLATVDTHTHADHITASGTLREKTGCEIVMSSTTCAEGVTVKLNDQQSFYYGTSELICLHTPGHTSDSCCYYSNEGFVLTGDTLLIRGTGRTDFQQGNAKQAFKNIQEKLLPLAGNTKVYPGHDYKGFTVSTIAEEKKNNPRLQVKDAEAYEVLMNSLNLSYPRKIDQALPQNMKCGL